MSDHAATVARVANGNLVNVHPAEACAGRCCCIHNPSGHHMADWPMVWRGDRGLMERLCECGIGHPDPDHLEFIRTTQGDEAVEAEAIHGCCGCCAPPPA